MTGEKARLMSQLDISSELLHAHRPMPNGLCARCRDRRSPCNLAVQAEIVRESTQRRIDELERQWRALAGPTMALRTHKLGG